MHVYRGHSLQPRQACATVPEYRKSMSVTKTGQNLKERLQIYFSFLSMQLQLTVLLPLRL